MSDVIAELVVRVARLEDDVARLTARITVPQTASASGPPSSGTWALGAVAYNSAPAPGGVIGWVCTTAGSPGVWKSWGAISS